jgi:hypothetical protein
VRDIGWTLLAPVGLVALVVLGPLVVIGIVLWTILLILVGAASYLLGGDALSDLQRLYRWLT